MAQDTREAECRLCNKPTSVVVNINFKAVPVCDSCCLAITKQEVATWRLRSAVEKAEKTQ